MKMNPKNKWINMAAVVFATCLFTMSCEKKFTDPPILGEPDIVANITIKDVKVRYTSGVPVAISDDAVIEGVVSCDDKSGNYYQQIAIQDATGGVLLRLAGNNHFNNYPVGRKVYVKLKGLNQPIIPQVVNVSQLTTNLQDKYVSTVIKLEGFEFASGELGKNYADDNQSGNRIIQGCTTPTTNKITLRTSNYSNFATVRVAQGNGDINSPSGIQLMYDFMVPVVRLRLVMAVLIYRLPRLLSILITSEPVAFLQVFM